MTEISIADVRKVVNRLLDHITDTRKIEKITIDDDLYWEIPSDNRYDMSSDIEELYVGNLVDDWGFVSGLLDENVTPVTYQLTEVAPILRFIGEKLGEELAGKGG